MSKYMFEYIIETIANSQRVVNSHTGQFWLVDSPILTSRAYSDFWPYCTANAGPGAGGRCHARSGADLSDHPALHILDGARQGWLVFGLIYRLPALMSPMQDDARAAEHE